MFLIQPLEEQDRMKVCIRIYKMMCINHFDQMKTSPEHLK